MSNFLSKLKSGKIKEVLLLALIAVVLIYSAWNIFHAETEEASASYDAMSESEIKVMRILQAIDGVGDASVVVCEADTKVKSVVIVCEGAKNLRVVMDVREAVASALDTEENSVKIYLKKD